MMFLHHHFEWCYPWLRRKMLILNTKCCLKRLKQQKYHAQVHKQHTRNSGVVLHKHYNSQMVLHNYTNIITQRWCYTNIITHGWFYTNIITHRWCYTNIITHRWCHTNILTHRWCYTNIITHGWCYTNILTHRWCYTNNILLRPIQSLNSMNHTHTVLGSCFSYWFWPLIVTNEPDN